MCLCESKIVIIFSPISVQPNCVASCYKAISTVFGVLMHHFPAWPKIQARAQLKTRLWVRISMVRVRGSGLLACCSSQSMQL